MRKLLLLIIVILFGSNLFSQKTNPFASLLYDRVVMYDYEPHEYGATIIDKNGVLEKKINKRVLLEKSAVDVLNKKLGQRSSFGRGISNCFIPHLGFVYYYKNNVVAHISVCMDCNRMFSNIPILGKKSGQVFRGSGSYYSDNDDGMSRSFRSFLKGLLLKNGFSHIPNE